MKPGIHQNTLYQRHDIFTFEGSLCTLKALFALRCLVQLNGIERGHGIAPIEVYKNVKFDFRATLLIEIRNFKTIRRLKTYSLEFSPIIVCHLPQNAIYPTIRDSHAPTQFLFHAEQHSNFVVVALPTVHSHSNHALHNRSPCQRFPYLSMYSTNIRT